MCKRICPKGKCHRDFLSRFRVSMITDGPERWRTSELCPAVSRSSQRHKE